MDIPEIKTKVEKCILQFGKDFQLVGDRHFWYEYDIQFRLLNRLSKEIEKDISFKEPRLVHANCAAQKGHRYVMRFSTLHLLGI
jgi:hypothetical protein